VQRPAFGRGRRAGQRRPAAFGSYHPYTKEVHRGNQSKSPPARAGARHQHQGAGRHPEPGRLHAAQPGVLQHCAGDARPEGPPGPAERDPGRAGAGARPQRRRRGRVGAAQHAAAGQERAARAVWRRLGRHADRRAEEALRAPPPGQKRGEERPGDPGVDERRTTNDQRRRPTFILHSPFRILPL